MISLVCTVLNEKTSIASWCDSLMRQTVLPDEVIIVDGGSADGTWEWLTDLAARSPLYRVFRDPGNISHGRNRAIQEARGQYIVVTDAGCTYDPSWFAKISAPLMSGTAVYSATGFGPDIHNEDGPLTIAIASATTPAPYEFQGDWLPSSRSVAFTRELWHTVGGYPEWLPYSEDLVFDLALGTQTPCTFIREPLVFWRPRRSLASYAKQLQNYSSSQWYAQILVSKHMARIIAVLVAVLLLSQKMYALAIVLMALYVYRYLRRARIFTSRVSVSTRVITVLLVPVVVLFGECTKLYGTLQGMYRRFTSPPRITYSQ